MAEKKEMRTENIKKTGEIIKDGKLDLFIKSTSKFESSLKGVKATLEEKLKALELARKESEAAVKEQPAEVEVKKPEKVEEVVAPTPEVPVKEKKKSHPDWGGFFVGYYPACFSI